MEPSATPSVQLLVAVACLLAAGCHESLDCCMDGGTLGVVRGHLLDATYAPLADAVVRTDGHRHRCDAIDEPGASAEGDTRSDSVGAFTLPVFSFLGAPGRFCVRLEIVPRGAAADISGPIEIEFFQGPVRDTTEVLLRLPEG